MGTFDITLPNTQRVYFPSRCVVCQKRNPDGVFKLSVLGIKTALIVKTATVTAK